MCGITSRRCVVLFPLMRMALRLNPNNWLQNDFLLLRCIPLLVTFLLLFSLAAAWTFPVIWDPHSQQIFWNLISSVHNVCMSFHFLGPTHLGLVRLPELWRWKSPCSDNMSLEGEWKYTRVLVDGTKTPMVPEEVKSNMESLGLSSNDLSALGACLWCQSFVNSIITRVSEDWPESRWDRVVLVNLACAWLGELVDRAEFVLMHRFVSKPSRTVVP